MRRENNENNEKKVYEKPQLVKHEQLREVTLRSGHGGGHGGGGPTASPI